MMTNEDQAAAIGRLVQLYSEAKRKRAAIIAECDRLARVLDTTARNLRNYDIRGTLVRALPGDFPERSSIAALISDLEATNKVLADKPEAHQRRRAERGLNASNIALAHYLESEIGDEYAPLQKARARRIQDRLLFALEHSKDAADAS